MTCKLLPIVKGDGVHRLFISRQNLDDGFFHHDAFFTFNRYGRQQARRTLHQRYDRPFMTSAHNQITLPVTYSAAFLYNRRTLFNAHTTAYLTAPIFTTKAPLPLLLPAQVAIQNTVIFPVGQQMTVYALMADRGFVLFLHALADLLRRPLLFQAFAHFLPCRCIKFAGMSITHAPFHGFLLRLLRAVATKPAVARNLSRDGRGVNAKRSGDITLSFLFTQKQVNLVSLILGKMRIAFQSCSFFVVVDWVRCLRILPHQRLSKKLHFVC
jgi:hypothetical protein